MINKNFNSYVRTTVLAGGLVALATPALAHHPLNGMPMETFTHGVLSGIGHPLLGFDHLFFVLLMGVAAFFTTKKFITPAAYIGAMLIGCMMMSLGLGLPAKELMIALSLVVLGAVVLSGKSLGMGAAVALFAGFGLFHGSAFGDSIAGQESAMGAQVLVGYLIGLGVLQYALALGAGLVTEKLMKATEATAISARLSGAMVAGVGIFLTLEHIEGVVLSAIF